MWQATRTHAAAACSSQHVSSSAWCGTTGMARLRRSMHVQAAMQHGQHHQTTQQQSQCRLKLVVAYDGSGFSGFQWQKGPKVRTVQDVVEKAAQRVFHTESRVVGASRTDGGAHALGQVAHLDVFGERSSFEADLMYMNGCLPDDVKVMEISAAPPGFDSHFSSCGKEYHYRLGCGMPNPLLAKYAWWVHDRWCEGSRGKPQSLAQMALDVAAMQQGAAALLGTHDFTAFMDKKRPAGLGSVKRKRPKLAVLGIKPVRTAEKNIRTLWTAEVLDEGQGNIRIVVAGDGFLYRMVRLIAAALVEVGHGRMRPEDIGKLLASGDRTRLPEAAPPTGLYLRSVLYELPEGLPPELAQASMLRRQEMLREAAEAAKAAAAGDGGPVTAEDAAGMLYAVAQQAVIGDDIQ